MQTLYNPFVLPSTTLLARVPLARVPLAKGSTKGSQKVCRPSTTLLYYLLRPLSVFSDDGQTVKYGLSIVQPLARVPLYRCQKDVGSLQIKILESRSHTRTETNHTLFVALVEKSLSKFCTILTRFLEKRLESKIYFLI